jgi:hypothetical protein
MAAEFQGNPDLKPERSTQGDLWIEADYSRVAVHASVFVRKIRDYITLEATDIAPLLPLSPPTVYRYVNGDATYYGGSSPLPPNWRSTSSAPSAELICGAGTTLSMNLRSGFLRRPSTSVFAGRIGPASSLRRVCCSMC